jgi:signal transduction histidine kinase/ActR/RegA family two-component response regulator
MVAFIVIILIAFSVASLRYFNQIAQHKQQSLSALQQEADQLNTMLKRSVEAVTGIQEFAQYILKHPNELNIPMPSLSQQGDRFYLNTPLHDVMQQGKRLSSNITGLGNLNEFSDLKKQEVAMANALTPGFIAAQSIIDEATWFYYVSFDNFVNIYPWIDREIWQFSKQTLTSPHHYRMKKLNPKTNQVVWSPPYIDAAGGGMNASLGKAVFHREKLLGSVVIDINLSRLHANLAELSSEDEGLILYNQNNEILLSKRSGKESLTYRAMWKDILPSSLTDLNAVYLNGIGDTKRIDEWYVEKQALNVNGWTLLKYQKFDNFTAPQYRDFIFVFAMLFIGLLAYLMLVNTMTKRTFIKPTTEFIRHIEYCSKGDPGKVTPAADWLYWFQKVEDIFAENQSLLLQLTEQNDVLDTRVVEKTKALQETSAKHQRDYALLRSVMNAIPELIVFNDPNGLLIGCNEAFERLTNHSVRQMLGYKSATFMPASLAAEVNRLSEMNENTFPQQALINAGNFTYQGFCDQFSDEQGNILGSIIIFHDVTIQQATQSALEKAKNQAEYANQIKLQFLANMSHEVRTPINAMQGMMNLLSGTAIDTRQHHYLTTAQSASKTLLHLVDELLDLSKIEAGKMVVSYAPVNLPTIIDKALKLNLSNVDYDQVEVIVDIEAKVPNYVNSDGKRLIQVLSNLLNNAIKFTAQGQIKLIVELLSDDATASDIRFSISDTGIGIADDKQSQLFTAFTQADESMTREYGGSGLGLSICQQIINLLGGEISLVSTLGQGSELSFILSMPHINCNYLENDSSKDTVVPLVETSQNLPNSVSQVEQISIAGVNIYTVNQSLSESLKQNIAQMYWPLYEVESFEELDQLAILNNAVLLIDEKNLISTTTKQTRTETLNTFKLVALCQPALKPLAIETCKKLDNLPVPYLLVDTPLFRYGLDQIALKLTEQAQAIKVQSNKQKNRSLSQRKKSKPTDIKAKNNNLQGVSVLLVEDNLVNQLVAKELLLSMQAKVTIANNGQQALSILVGQAFDVILMDIQMPIMDGLTAAKAIRAQQKYETLPIIAMTAHAREEDKKQSIAVGMNLHVPKPVTTNVLFNSIKQVLTT